MSGLEAVWKAILDLKYTEMMEFAGVIAGWVGGPYETTPADVADELSSWASGKRDESVKRSSASRSEKVQEILSQINPAVRPEPPLPLPDRADFTLSPKQGLTIEPVNRAPERQQEKPLGRVVVSAAGLKEMGVPFSKQHLWKMINEGKFPKPVKIGARRNAWVKAEVDAWIKARVEERPTPGAK